MPDRVAPPLAGRGPTAVAPRVLATALVATLVAGLAACARAPRPAGPPSPVSAAPAPPVPQAFDSASVRAISRRLLADAAGVPAASVPVPRIALDVDVSPFESEDRIARFVTLFTGEGRERFVARLERGTRYDALIRGRLRAAGLPEDLTYLALVESGYDPNAVSRASAVGMWQFMAATARELGLRVDWWVDERRDPVRATDAAVRNLRWLRREFGSLFLAAAAYNGGPGRVARGLAQLAAASDSSVGETRFFALVEAGHLREETSNYVPQIVAAALVAGEPERYGIAVRRLPQFAYDSAFVAPLTPLAAVARAAGVSRDSLLDLNPQLLRGLTPPGEATLVRLPPGAPDVAARLAALPSAERRAFRRVTTGARETLDRIAAREHVPAAELRRYNPRLAIVKKGKRKGTLVPDQALRVPTAAVLAYARPIADVDGDGPGDVPMPAAVASKAAASKPAAPDASAAAEHVSKASATKATASKSGGSKASATKASATKASATKASASKASASKASASKASASKPGASKPGASKPAASKPAASKPAASKPAASKAGVKSGAAKSDAARAAHAKPAGSAPAGGARKKTTPAAAHEPLRVRKDG